MPSSTAVRSNARARKTARNLCRRILATTLLGACVFVAPAIACVSHAPLHEVRLPRIDSRVIENLQRWAEGDKDSWSEEI